MKKLIVLLFLLTSLLYAEVGRSPFGADAVPDLYSAELAGAGSYTTSMGGAPASAVNPAQAGEANRMVFDAGYLAIPAIKGLGREDDGFMQSIYLGALFPTRYGVFGGSLRYIGGFSNGQFTYFPIDPTFGGNIFAGKEIYPGMSVGAGINFGFGAEGTFSADFGFRHNVGKAGFLENFTWAVVLRGLGLSYFPSWLTPAAGVSFDVFRIKGDGAQKDPFVLNAAFDVIVPSLFTFNDQTSLIFKVGVNATIAELITLSASWPGGSGFNVREIRENTAAFPVTPSIGIGFNFLLPSGGERIAGGRLPSDGDLKISTAIKPLYEGVTAMGGGVSWYVGVADKKPPVLSLDYSQPGFFSPNNDGKADFLEIPINITDEGYISSWKVEIKDAAGNVVRVIENKEPTFERFNLKDFFFRIFSEKKHIDVPDVIRWDGLNNTGQLAPDGRYFFTITATDDSDNTAVTPVYEAVLKNAPPVIAINPIPDVQKIFDPKGGGGRASITFTSTGSVEETWESGIWNSAGERIRSFRSHNGAPAPVVWDGKDDFGNIASDGVYSFRISATDRAMNSASAEMTNIILDSREAGAFVTASVPAIAPARNQTADMVNFSIRLLLNDGIDSWKLELKDETGTVQRTFSGGTRVPATQGWNGLTQDGQIREGRYTPQLSVNYTRGDVVTASAATVLVDVSGPELTVVPTPEYFSPDNDGDNDELFINITARDASPISIWSMVIREPEPPYNVFRRIEGRGSPANQIVWDGRSDRGELVQSATYYPYTFSATDALGNSSSVEGRIGVDVLVIRDGDRLRIQIPSIVFRPDHADFVGLSREVVDNNNRIIRRVAQILNQFRDYRVMVEGHGNAVHPVGPARDRDEPDVRRISEARARAIVDMLVRNGVVRNRLSFTGAGSSRPVVEFEDRDNWWKNRRVEFYLIK